MQDLQKNDARSYRMSLRIIGQLVDSGIKKIVVSPGFRNSPLLLAAHHNKSLEVISGVDERGAAFFALGCAKADRMAVAVLCTSGTAVGNYLPAVMESYHSNVPLVVITADRPQEHSGIGANQATNQIGIFKNHVLDFVDVQAPNDDFDYINHAVFSVAKIVSKCLGPRSGPIHINVHFREPFLPRAEIVEALQVEEKSSSKWKIVRSSAGPGKEQLDAFLQMLKTADRPIFALGPAGYSQERLEKIAQLSDHLGIPVLAEACSGIAFLGKNTPVNLLHRADAVLTKMLAGELSAPDLVIRFGAPLISKNYSRLLKTVQPVQIIFEEAGEAREPDLYPSIFFQGGTDGWLHTLDYSKVQPSVNHSWIENLKLAEKSIEESLDAHLKNFRDISEWGFHRKLSQKISEESQIFLGNSMPIRDFLSVFPRSSNKYRIFSNRGLSGIDGLLASALGVAFASHKETHAILGDLSTLHDLSSFSLLEDLRKSINFTLWVMNNGGGEIFRLVGTSKAGGEEAWFTTPKSFDLAALAKSFRIGFTRVHSSEELDAIGSDHFREPGARIIEVMADPETNGKIREFFRSSSTQR